MATTKSTGFKLSVMTLAIMNITAVVSLRGLPAEAVYGLSSAFYYLFAAVVFLIPTAMVAAELAAMFSDKQGGVFRWVGEAYGARTGFLAIWLQWIESTIWYPTVLTFGAVSIAFIGMNDAHDIGKLLDIMATLRKPDGGCPWDLAQDFSTIAPYTIEEAYEVADAIDRGDLTDLKDELGDLLLQVVFHAQMAKEQGAFDFGDVVAAICDKMVRRHPHVFGDASFADAEAPTANWEAIKRAERKAAGEEDGSARAALRPPLIHI